MPPLLIAAVPPPPEAGGWDSAARHLLGVTGWCIPRWMHPAFVSPADVLSVYVDVAFLWPDYQHVRPRAEARLRALELDTSRRVVVLLGREAQLACRDKAEWLDFFEWGQGDALAYALLPYPSPWNRLWNYRENRRLGRQMLVRAVAMTEQPSALGA